MQLPILLLTISSITVFLLIAGQALRDKTNDRSKYLLMATAFSLASGLMMGISLEPGSAPIFRLTFRFFDLPSTGLLWWFILSLLDDHFKIGRLAWAGMIAVLIPSTIFWLEDMGVPDLLFPGIDYLNPLIFTALLIHILWVGLSGLKDDLINRRREVRLWIVVLLTLTAAASIIAGYTLDGDARRLVRGLIILPSALLMFFWSTRFVPSVLQFASPDQGPDHGLDTMAGIDPRDGAAYKRLLNIMETEKAYLDPDLSVSQLAERVGVPPHQLRNLINRGLKFRNFTAFLASYRIAAVKQALADPEKARIPILTLAMDTGFASLTTFNRTFKNETGQTAGEFRQHALNADDQ